MRNHQSYINVISKQVQLKNILIDIAIESAHGLMSFFGRYRETVFLEALDAAKEIIRAHESPTGPRS
jgi:hypothetical protein